MLLEYIWAASYDGIAGMSSRNPTHFYKTLSSICPVQAPIQQQLFSSDLLDYVGKRVTVYGYYVTAKRTITSKGELMYFGTFIDSKGDHIDTVHFPPSAKRYPLKGRGVYRLTGRVTAEFDCVNVEVDELEKLAIIQDPRYTDEPRQKVG